MKLFRYAGSDGVYTATEQVVINLLQTSGWLQNELNRILGRFGITLNQYAVLRILQEYHPEPMTCKDIRKAMLERTPDLTRLLKRLERSGLIERSRSKEDARASRIRMTARSVELMQQASDETDSAARLYRCGISQTAAGVHALQGQGRTDGLLGALAFHSFQRQARARRDAAEPVHALAAFRLG